MTDARAWLERYADEAHLRPVMAATFMRVALLAVLDLHKEDWEGWCDECGLSWPCATARAIDQALGVTGPHEHQWRGVVDGTSYCVDCGVERDD